MIILDGYAVIALYLSVFALGLYLTIWLFIPSDKDMALSLRRYRVFDRARRQPTGRRS